MAHSRYEVDIDIDQANNSSYWHLASFIGSNKRVLDVGCDTGNFGQALMRRNNEVVGVEVVESTAEKARAKLPHVVVADLNHHDLVSTFGAGSFDVVCFGDVLEHLLDPVSVLRQATQLLSPQGFVVISVPNVAHGDIRLALLDGRWTYTETGLLDSTHVHFFTHQTLIEHLKRADLVLAELRRTDVDLFATEVGVRREDYPPELVERIEADFESRTYQFVCKAAPRSLASDAEDLAERFYRASIRVNELEKMVHERDAAFANVWAQRTQLDEEVASLRQQIDDLARGRPNRDQRRGRAFGR